ncbi:MAG: methyltransferase [Candidatus Methanoperedens sp.]|nr:methyltransferase [Candidatus Methanoperedens sp.]
MKKKPVNFFSGFIGRKSGGKVLIAEMIADDERKKVVFPLMFAANMLVNSTEGNTFTIVEFREWLKEAGFFRNEPY